jgi:hypothetical protein
METTDQCPIDQAEDADDERVAEGLPPEGPSVTETVATTATGIAVGGAALWFLAPICFVC